MPRRLVLTTFIVLMALNFIVGGMGYYYLGQVDQNYSKLLNQGVPVLNNMQSATAEATRSYALAVDLLQSQTAEERVRTASEIKAHLGVADRIYASTALVEAVPKDLRPEFTVLLASRQAWRKGATDYLQQIETGDVDSARQKLHSQVYPALRDYINKLDGFCDSFQATSEQQHRLLMRSNDEHRSLLIRFAAVPLLGLTAVAMVFAFALLLNGWRSASPSLPPHRPDSAAPFASTGIQASRRWIFPDRLEGIARPQKQAILKQNAKVIWLYGLSGSGKTAIAEALERQLFAAGRFACILDGDAVRSGLNQDLGFSDEDRSENIRRVAEVAKMHVQDGLICIVALITPRRSFRMHARSIIGRDDFVEVFISASVEVCSRRDPKGLYSLNKTGQVQQLSGRDSTFEPPAQGDAAIVIDTERSDVAHCADQLFRAVGKSLV